jgi:hypothetical protein
VVFRKMILRGKTLTFWQKSYDLAKPILRGKSKKLLKFFSYYAILIETNCERNQAMMSDF